MSSFKYSGSSCSEHSESSLEETPPPRAASSAYSITPNLVDNNIGVCRDFLRNACRRGLHCRYRHVLDGALHADPLVFCRDFQNSGCRRPACRFVHCTRDQEEEYKRTGQLPIGVVSTDDRSLAYLQSETNEPPVCIDYIKNDCKRGSSCKYRHLSTSSIDNDNEQQLVHDRQRSLKMAAVEAAMIFEDTGLKRRRRSDRMGFDVSDFSHRSRRSCGYVSIVEYQLLEEENRLLHHKVDELKRNISVLVATNELLLEQNARIRSHYNLVLPSPVIGASHLLAPAITPSVRTQVHNAGAHGITTMATLGHLAFGDHREFLVQPGTIVTNQQPGAPAGATVGATAAGDEGASAGSVTIVPMTIPVEGQAGPNLGTAPAIAAIGNQNISGLNGQNIGVLGAQNISGIATGQNMGNLSAANLVPVTRASIMSNVALDVSNISINVPSLSVQNMVMSAAPPIVISATPNVVMSGAPNMVMSATNMTIGGSGNMSGSSIEHCSGPSMAYGSSSIANIITSDMTMPAALNGNTGIIKSCSVAGAPPPVPPPGQINLTPQQTNANIISYPLMSHSQPSC